MARLPESFPIGQNENIDLETLLELMQRMYTDLAIAINQKPDLVQRTTDGQPNDGFLDQGTININTGTLKVEMLTAHTGQTSVTWTKLSP